MLGLPLLLTLPAEQHLVELDVAGNLGCRKGLLSMMLLCMIVKLVKLVDRIEMHKTDYFGKTRLVPHIPSSS